MSSSPFEVIIDPYFRKYENKLLWDLLPKFFMEAKFTITENCIKIQAQSPGAKTYVQITLFKDFFRSLKGNHVFQLRVYSKKHIPHFKLSQDCKAVIWSSERNFVFNYEIKYYSNRQTRFEAIEDNSFEFRPVFRPFNREVEFCLPTKLLHEILDDMKSDFSSNTDKFKLTSDNTLGNVAFSYDLGGIASYKQRLVAI